MTEVHGLTVEQVPDARLVDWMCQVRPGLPAQYADLALQALKTLHMTVHRDGEQCGEQPVPAVCAAQDSGLFGSTLSCVLAEHDDEWHDNGRGTWWKSTANGAQLKASASRSM